MNNQELGLWAGDIEAALGGLGVPVRVTGGTILPTHVKFMVRPLLGGISQIRRIVESDDFPGPARVSRRGTRVVITIQRQNATTLSELLDDIEPVAFTAALGVEETENSSAPLLINLESEAGNHILITGQGRDELLAIITESLQRWNEPESLWVSWVGDVTVSDLVRHEGVVVLLTEDITPGLHRLMAQGEAHIVMSTDYADNELCEMFPCYIRGLGDGCYKYEAMPDWEGTFYAPATR